MTIDKKRLPTRILPRARRRSKSAQGRMSLGIIAVLPGRPAESSH